MNKQHEATKEFLKSDLPEFDSGDTVAIDVKVKEGNKERIQRFEGVVVGRRGGKGLDASFTVRKVTNGVGVERIFPLHSPMISNIEVKRRGKVRRAKLNYLKNVTGAKAARIEEKRYLNTYLNPSPSANNSCGRGFFICLKRITTFYTLPHYPI